MKMKTTKEMIDVMQSYLCGEKIEFLNGKKWRDADNPVWDWIHNDYRVKPKTKYVPFDTAEEFLTAQRKHGEIVRCKLDDELYYAYINSGNETILVNNLEHTCSIITNIVNMYDEYEFEDGTPCGKEV